MMQQPSLMLAEHLSRPMWLEEVLIYMVVMLPLKIQQELLLKAI